MSITKKIARLREQHYLEVRALLGRKGHNYKEERNLDIEGILELADAYNYLKRDEGTIDLAEEAAALGDRVAGRGGLGR